MKKFLFSHVFIVFLALFGVILNVRAGEPGIDGAELNGDTNCDGTRDISDAITLAKNEGFNADIYGPLAFDNSISKKYNNTNTRRTIEDFFIISAIILLIIEVILLRVWKI